ncbi:aldehyde dehydrogenase (NAD+) [Virgibacillus natechei]|uniref:Aldehyde dehydrogenase (NAD+) n=1 Tax=Virgibacillus natechei TaxID=1216297 RepID=A0ABS4IL60_9BACI|nr:aldehyde dehydrogenase family protein [Virgibacillus natechei]MBP1971703.1 aldehyde dehydrogenase (NAD+) [Virgibacillus natechei]UZD12155.1 aldehyde dehydrogenase family protein [Virgibacillus natechei]
MTTKAKVFEGVNKQFIGGKWKEGTSGKVATIEDPFDNSEFAKVVLASKEDVDEAYNSAKRAQKKWAITSKEEKVDVLERAIRIMEENKKEIVDIIAREAGGTVLKGNLEVQLTLDIMNEAKTFPHRMEPKTEPSAIPGKENRIYRFPIGVMSVISPFNFPLNLSMRSVVTAIAAGNAVVHKPALQTAITGGGVIAKVFELAGLPAGVFNLIITSSSETGDYFVEHPIPKFISFTGSTEVGRHIGSLAGKHLKRVALELGGNSPFVVLKDADVDQAVNAAIFGKFVHQGQICMIVNRILVHRDIYDEFAEKFTKRASELPYGDPKDSKNIIGPIANEKQIETIMGLIETAKKEGALVSLEGKRAGNVITPFVFTNVTNDMTIAQSEIFGPLATLIPFDSDEEGIQLANDTEYGLSSAIFTSDLARGEEFAKQVESGMTHVNDQTVNDEPTVPFGGVKDSGIGRFGGEWVLDEFTTMKWISVQKEDRVFPF